jgi:TetR/AcrR family transcriptional regulator, mexCD-oprJ operon repressor
MILDTAAGVIAERGSTVTMSELAAAAGVGRATLYRYFPNRDALLAGLTATAMAELADNIAAAELETVDVVEGVARLGRAFLAAASRYGVLMQAGPKHVQKPADLETKIIRPVRELLRRGIEAGRLRTDVPLELHFELLTGLFEKALQLVLSGRMPPERASALISSIFFDGAGVRTARSVAGD